MIFYGDLETYCETPIQHGTHRYAETAEIMVISFAIDDDPVQVWDVTNRPDMNWRPALANYLDMADEVVFHKSEFDRTVLRLAAGIEIPMHKMRDTFVQALAHSLSGGMDKLCKILNVPHDLAKMAEGKKLIQLFCKPRPKNSKIRRATSETHPEEWRTFLDYAAHDIEAMRYFYQKLPRWNFSGRALDLWHLDQRINDRGLLVDMEMVDAAIAVIERERKRLAKHAKRLSNGEVSSTTQRDRLMEHLLAEHGVLLPDMKGDTIKRRLEDEDLPDAVRALLDNRMEATRASLAKYKAIKRSVSADGRVRGTLQFAGARRTSRWAGRILQGQNLMRPPPYLTGRGPVDDARGAIKGMYVDLVYEKPMEVLSAAVPWVITAPAGKKLALADLSQIESRMLAWLAGADWKLDIFRRYDENPKDKARDPYILGYAQTFSQPLEAVIANYESGGDWRQFGKIQELFLGYQGAVGAYVTGAVTYHIDMDADGPLGRRAATLPKDLYDMGAKDWRRAEAEGRTFDLDRQVYITCYANVQLWRRRNPEIVQFWWDLQAAVREAIRKPGMLFTVGRLKIRSDGAWLGIKLPSGHTLCYPNPKVVEGKIQYKGENQYSRKWGTTETYGGKLVENVTQALSTGSGGILGEAMPPVEAAGYEIITHTHDELVAECPDTDDYSHEQLGEIFIAGHDWADGLPLSTGGFDTKFYRKDK